VYHTLKLKRFLLAGQAGHVYYSQTFTGGVGGRSTELRARCNLRNEHALSSAGEPSPHHYILELLTPFSCDLNCVAKG